MVSLTFLQFETLTKWYMGFEPPVIALVKYIIVVKLAKNFPL